MLIETIILGLIQGITEWVPISSTGHLRIAEYFLGLESPLFFDLILHIGTLIVTLFFFRSDIKKLIYSIYKWEFTTENGKLVPLIIIGTIPTAIIGFLFSSSISLYFIDLWPISGAYIFCGIILYFSKKGKEQKNKFRYFDAIQIGIAQGIAIIPGISRSGFTIAFALLLGIKKEIAFKFSFLLSIPAIIGGLSLTFYQQPDMLRYVGVDLIEIFVGIIVTIIVGYFSLKILQKSLVAKKFHLFAFYCWFLSIILIVLSLLGF
jgi:undecaprenyl-diphosphatase